MQEKGRIPRKAVEQWNQSTRTNIERELGAFRQMLPMLLPATRGWFVALSGGEVIDRDKDEFVLANRVAQKFPGKFVLIQEVQEFVNVPACAAPPVTYGALRA